MKKVGIQQLKIKERFRQSIKCGTGEAYFILRDNPSIDFSKEITKAALHNLALDGQVEGSRAYYVAQLIYLSAKKDRIVNSVLVALLQERTDTWALVQLFDLAAIFAKEGNKEARKAIYKRYYKKVIEGSEWCGEDSIVELDGLEGLIYIAEIRGKGFEINPDDWEDSFLVDSFQEKNPTIKVYRELKKSAKDNLFIRKYVESIEKHLWSRSKSPKRPIFNYSKVHENIENKKIVPIPPMSVKDLSKDDIKKLANDFLKEIDPEKQEKYLRVFKETKYPYNYGPILEIAKKPNSRKNRRVEYACEALQHFKAIDIRQFALEKLNKTNIPAAYLPLLIANYRKGDWKLLRLIAEKYKDEFIIHSLVWGYIDIYKTNKTKECKIPLEIIYGKLTCGHHRLDLLEILYKNGVLSMRILKEMEYDSFEEIRKLHKKIKAKRPVR